MLVNISLHKNDMCEWWLQVSQNQWLVLFVLWEHQKQINIQTSGSVVTMNNWEFEGTSLSPAMGTSADTVFSAKPNAQQIRGN